MTIAAQLIFITARKGAELWAVNAPSLGEPKQLGSMKVRVSGSGSRSLLPRTVAAPLPAASVAQRAAWTRVVFTFHYFFSLCSAFSR